MKKGRQTYLRIQLILLSFRKFFRVSYYLVILCDSLRNSFFTKSRRLILTVRLEKSGAQGKRLQDINWVVVDK